MTLRRRCVQQRAACRRGRVTRDVDRVLERNARTVGVAKRKFADEFVHCLRAPDGAEAAGGRGMNLPGRIEQALRTKMPDEPAPAIGGRYEINFKSRRYQLGPAFQE